MTFMDYFWLAFGLICVFGGGYAFVLVNKSFNNFRKKFSKDVNWAVIATLIVLNAAAIAFLWLGAFVLEPFLTRWFAYQMQLTRELGYQMSSQVQADRDGQKTIDQICRESSGYKGN